MLSPESCSNYFKLGSSTRRHGVIGCIGYENANPPLCITCVETAEIGVGTSRHDDGGDQDSVCPICLEHFHSECAPQKNFATTDCGHTFCLSCLLTNLHTSNLCPLCRTPIEKDVKHVLKPLSYSEGIGLLHHELNGLRILEDIDRFVQNAIEVSTNSQTDGQNVEEIVGDLMNMVTVFGFNLLYDAALHSSGSEQNMDQEWIIQMYNDDDSDDSDDQSNDDDESNDDDSTVQDDSDSDSDDDDEDDSKSESESNENKKIMLPEVPESMLD
jgi:hypothetical protein